MNFIFLWLGILCRKKFINWKLASMYKFSLLTWPRIFFKDILKYVLRFFQGENLSQRSNIKRY